MFCLQKLKMEIGQRVKIFSKNLSDEYKYLNGMFGTIIKYDHKKVLLKYKIKVENGEIFWFSDGEVSEA